MKKAKEKGSPIKQKKIIKDKQPAQDKGTFKKKGTGTKEKTSSGNEEEVKDIVEKEFLGFPDVAEDVFNVLLYAGKQVVKRENLLEGPTESIYQGKKRLRNQFEDFCVYEMEGGKVKLMYLVANQSRINGKMLLRKAGYVGGVYRGQYEGKRPDTFPVIELVLYWGKQRWERNHTFRDFFKEKKISEDNWKYIDEMKLHVFQMRHLPKETRKLFQSDMGIVVDFLAEGKGYRSDRKIMHKAALIKMIKVLSGDMDIDGVEAWMEEQGIREEDEVKVCELFDQYERRGEKRGIEKGKAEGKAEDILDFLRDCGEIPERLQEVIFKERNLEVLRKWLKISAKVKSVEEFQKAIL